MQRKVNKEETSPTQLRVQANRGDHEDHNETNEDVNFEEHLRQMHGFDCEGHEAEVDLVAEYEEAK